jgi:hypothetical protein
LDPITGQLIRASKTTAVRYERSAPGELVHMDVKKLGRIPHGGGWKAHGRAMGSTAEGRRATLGYDYVHSLVDDHSRLAYSDPNPRIAWRVDLWVVLLIFSWLFSGCGHVADPGVAPGSRFPRFLGRGRVAGVVRAG